jgi:hypothetical protein
MYIIISSRVSDSLRHVIYVSFTSLSAEQFFGLARVSFVNHKQTGCQGKMKQFPPVSTTAPSYKMHIIVHTYSIWKTTKRNINISLSLSLPLDI